MSLQNTPCDYLDSGNTGDVIFEVLGGSGSIPGSYDPAVATASTGITTR